MNWGNLGGNALFALAIVVLVYLVFFFRVQRRPERTRTDIVRDLLSEVRLNQAMAEYFRRQPEMKMFEASCWEVNKARLSFLDQSVRDNLSEAFAAVEDYNLEIKAARKQKSNSLPAKIKVDKVAESLDKARQGLEDWLQFNFGAQGPPPKLPSVTDGLFGGKND